MDRNIDEKELVDIVQSARIRGLLGMLFIIVISTFFLDFGRLHHKAIVTAILYILFVILPSFLFVRSHNVHIWIFLCKWSYLAIFLLCFLVQCFY